MTKAKRFWSSIIVAVFTTAFAVVLLEAWSSFGETAGSDADADPIIERMFERGERYNNDQFRGTYGASLTRVDRRVDGEGNVQEEQTVEYEVIPIEGGYFERQVSIDGRSLDDGERIEEGEREAEFREHMRRIREGVESPEENENTINVNEELFARYTVTLEGEEFLRGRRNYRLAFHPREGRLPVHRSIDRALNRSRGHLWIDLETYEPSRLEFKLNGKVRLWWGLLGTIHEVYGVVDREPVLNELWAKTRQEVYADVRVFFSRSRRIQIGQWRDFVPSE